MREKLINTDWVTKMKILVGIKRVIDHNMKIRLKSDQSGIDLTDARMTINPFCEIALEEAVRLKEAGLASEVIVASVGTEKSQEQLRNALALGADRAILVKTNDSNIEPLNIAKALTVIMKKEQPGLAILGKQSIDSDNNQVGQMLAMLTKRPQGTFASKIRVDGDFIHVTREIDSGLRTIKLEMPAIVTTDLSLNEPRYARLPEIIKARRKSLEVLSMDNLGISMKQHIRLDSVNTSNQRSAGIIVNSVDELISKLRDEAKVIE